MVEQTLQSLLQSYRDAARTERDKGTYFERFTIAYLTHDPLQLEQYERVQTFKDWAAANGWASANAKCQSRGEPLPLANALQCSLS
jgi:predicted helicase